MSGATPIDASILSRLLAERLPIRDIARRFQTDERKIKATMAALGFVRDSRAQSDESRALDARVAELAREGGTSGTIAAQLGISRNTVIGRAARAGILLGGGHERRRIKLRPKVDKPPKPKVERKAPPRVVLTPSPAIVASRVEPVMAGRVGGVPFLELAPRGCKFAVGRDALGSHLFCGGDRADGLPYCRHHAQIAYRPIERKIPRRAA